MDDGQRGERYVVTLNERSRDALGNETDRVRVLHNDIEQYRVKEGVLYLYTDWTETEFGVRAHLSAAYGRGSWFKMERV